MNSFAGAIMLFGGDFAPQGWELCNGQLLSIAQNTALFSILGTKYGGDGKTTFALPNLSGPEGTTYIICIFGVMPASISGSGVGPHASA